jgi:hypothetical protein
LEQKKKELAHQLGYALNSVKEQQPKVEEQLNAEILKQDRIKEKLTNLDKDFGKRKDDILKQMGEVSSKLKDIKWITRKVKHQQTQLRTI